MLDPRIYRMGIIPVILAVVVLAFSLEDQQGALSTNIVPDAFSGTHAFTTMRRLASTYPNRRPGSAGDYLLAHRLARQLHRYGFRVSTDTFRAPTPQGSRTLENLIAVRAGAGAGSVVIVSHRDALGSPAVADLSGTAVMLELARVLAGQTLDRTLILASTTGSDGASGAQRLVSEPPDPVDAVVVLGDMAGTPAPDPVVSPWSNGQNVASTELRNTLSGALSKQAGLTAGNPGLPGQVARLAFPMIATEQAPFVSSGFSAALVSLSGGRTPAPDESVSLARISGTGRAALEAVTALEAGEAVGASSSYLLGSGTVIPAWAVRLLVLVLILPVLAVTIDGLARSRRKGHSISRWIGWVGAGALPFILAALLVVIARLTGWIGPASRVPVNGGGWPLGGGGIALLVVMGLVIVAGLVWLRPLLIRWLGLRTGPTPSEGPAMSSSLGPARRARSGPEGGLGPGAATGVLLMMCLVALTVWFANPFAALLLLPALHLWLWVVTPDIQLPVPVTVALLLVGLAPVALVAADVATTLGVGPVGLAWDGTLLLAGGGLGVWGAIEWSLFAGCAFSVVVITVRDALLSRSPEVQVTIRGPISYAGPGSLGGTKSTLRR